MWNGDLFQYGWSRVGTARQCVELIPKVQLWFRSAQQWVGDLDSIRKMENSLLLTRLDLEGRFWHD